MKTRPVDPERLDVEAFAKNQGELEGAWPLNGMDRLRDVFAPGHGATDQDSASWSLSGESRAVQAGSPEIWLHVQGSAVVALQCQRCLGPVETHLEVERSFRFVRDEASAEALDAESEDDVLVLPRYLDTRLLLEEELLLALPIVPLHEVCPVPVVMSSGEIEEEAEPAPNPFAALAALKRGGGLN